MCFDFFYWQQHPQTVSRGNTWYKNKHNFPIEPLSWLSCGRWLNETFTLNLLPVRGVVSGHGMARHWKTYDEEEKRAFAHWTLHCSLGRYLGRGLKLRCVWGRGRLGCVSASTGRATDTWTKLLTTSEILFFIDTVSENSINSGFFYFFLDFATGRVQK